MIIKGQARGRAKQLANHLSRRDENEDVHLFECRGTIATDVEGALAEMEAHGLRGRSKRPLYHASISPEPGRPLSREQIGHAVDTLEAHLGLHRQPRIVVAHTKAGRQHFHVVWSRTDIAGKAVSDSWNYARHEEVARELETIFGHSRVDGAHGHQGGSRPSLATKEYELRQTARSGLDRAGFARELTQLWNASDSGSAFKRAIEDAGYQLVRGDRRGFVVLDAAGEAHSLSRRLNGISSTDIKKKLNGIDLAKLPSVTEGRSKRTYRSRAVSQQLRVAVPMALTTFSLSGGRLSRRVWVNARRGHAFAAEFSAITTEFAAKLAAISTSGSREEVAAQIRRLREEEAATLRALEQRLKAEDKVASSQRLRSGFREAAVLMTRRGRPGFGRSHTRATGLPQKG